jgi:hypothetical protein
MDIIFILTVRRSRRRGGGGGGGQFDIVDIDIE